MKLNEKYNQTYFTEFVVNLLPEDFVLREEDIIIKKDRYKEITKAKELGFCKSLDLHVLEMDHSHNKDPRVIIATDAFKILADHWINKALVIFKNNDSENYRLSYLTINLDLNDKNKIIKNYSNARRYSFYLGVGAKTKTPEQQLLGKGKVKDPEDLLNRFSVEVVNKQFYLEVAKFFDELVSTDKENLVILNPLNVDLNARKSFAVRLIGRIMFCWFLKQKKSDKGQLIPDEILSSNAVSDNYYHNILEPLFFGILNTSIDARDIRSELFDNVPYLNGGLFNPQADDYYELNRDTFVSKYVDIFTIKDDWFIKFFELLELYNFTIDENTVFDQELSVDPEMLGRIFENLLAEINPETGSSDRKRTGSFYTPRQIVEYMVDQSLIEYLEIKTGIESRKISALVSYDLNDDTENPLNDVEKKKIIYALESLKILDPACGSGAYPIGVLQKIVYILQQIDPDCTMWLDEKLVGVSDLYKQKIINEVKQNPFDYTRKLDVIKNSIFGVDIQPIAVDVARLRCFLTLIVESEINDTKPNRGIEPLPNLDFKFVCANTLISAPEQSVEDENTLFGDFFQEKMTSAIDRYFSSSGENKRSANNEIHKLIDGKIEEKIGHIANYTSLGGIKEIEEMLIKANKKDIDKHSNILKLWASYKNIFENKPVDFFDTKYFFPGIKDGFDIVIGNPPYVQIQKFSGTEIQKSLQDQKYKTFEKTGDLYSLFYERGLMLTKKDSGLLCYITSNKWIRARYGKTLRQYFIDHDPRILIDLGESVFESAIVDTNIILIQNRMNTKNTVAISLKDKKEDLNAQIKDDAIIMSFIDSEGWFIGSQFEIGLKNKIKSLGKPLTDWNVNINYGIKTALNEAFIINKETRDMLLLEDKKSQEIIKPVLGGRSLTRYSYDFKDSYILATGYDIDIPKHYPAVFNHLKKFEEKAKKRDDQGINWWNLRSCAYYDEFEKDKMVWVGLNRKWKFSFVDAGMFVDASMSFLTGNRIKYIIGVISSKLILYYFKQIGSYHDSTGYMCKIETIKQLPIPEITEKNKHIVSKIEERVDQIIKLKKQDKDTNIGYLEKEIDNLVYKLYELTDDEIKIIEQSNLIK